MLATKALATGTIKILSLDEETGTVSVQFNDEKPARRVLKILKTRNDFDVTFKFKGTLWFLGYDFNLVFNDYGELMPPIPVEEMIPFFVYGTLRTGMGNHGYFNGRLDRSVPAKVDGEIYHNGVIPYMFEASSVVRGELMYVKPDKYNITMRDLDRLEGYYGEGFSYNHYNRKLVTAIANDGSEIRAWAYYANEGRGSTTSKKQLTRIKDGDFVRWHKEFWGDFDYYRSVRTRRV